MAIGRVFREGKTIFVQGDLGIADLRHPLACVHQCVEIAGHQELLIDFSNCSAAFPAPMLALCAQVMRLRATGVEVSLVLPSDIRLAKLFRNTNWAYLLDPRRYEPSSFKGHTQIPATRFASGPEQTTAVNTIVASILGVIPEIERGDFAALEWSINEITDNVLMHAQSPVGGLVQVSIFQKTQRRLQYIVADAGLGIPATLRHGHPDLTSDVDALDRAIREGVTRGKMLGQGNGLFGSYQICSHSRGSFLLESGYARLSFDERRALRIDKVTSPYEGTLIATTIDFSNPGLLQDALKFGGNPHSPVDFIELHYEMKDPEKVVFSMKDETQSFGTRVAGTPIRTKLANLLQMCPAEKIVVDFAEVALVSSSFADEVFGKLFLQIGPVRFIQRFEFAGVSDTVRQLIDRAISQRLTVRNN